MNDAKVESLVEEVANNPADQNLKLVLADYLEDHEDPRHYRLRALDLAYREAAKLRQHGGSLNCKGPYRSSALAEALHVDLHGRPVPVPIDLYFDERNRWIEIIRVCMATCLRALWVDTYKISSPWQSASPAARQLVQLVELDWCGLLARPDEKLYEVQKDVLRIVCQETEWPLNDDSIIRLSTARVRPDLSGDIAAVSLAYETTADSLHAVSKWSACEVPKILGCCCKRSIAVRRWCYRVAAQFGRWLAVFPLSIRAYSDGVEYHYLRRSNNAGTGNPVPNVVAGPL